MVDAAALKNGTTFESNGIPYLVLKYELQKVARGGGTVKLTLRNLVNGNMERKVCNSTAKYELISTTKRSLQYLFKDASTACFMDEKTYEQVEIPISIVKNEIQFIKEGQLANVLFWDDRPLSVDIAPKVTLEVTQTSPGVKGNSATNVFKPAILENGLEIKVPLFIKTGDKIRVDTRSGEYLERMTGKGI
ncbi:elongation factor P [Candidatus Woesebacteria bacterium]|nr:MAG: elongation factor P [Candidatus Woesebacteria bacterium]